MPVKRLVVKARKDERHSWSWQGGFIEQGEHSGRPWYQRDTSDGGDKYCIFYQKALRAWFIGERLPIGSRVAYSVRSKNNARSVEEAIWDSAKVQELFAKQEGDEEDCYDELFKDPDFPHCVASINRPGFTPIPLLGGEPQWVPGRALRKGQWKLFDVIDARDLLQGKVGDCWLLSAIAAMAEFPREVMKVFRRDGLAEGDGRYVLHLFDHKEGCMRDVTVDEYVPCQPKRWWQEEAEPCFAHPNGEELWCLVLEKAMAKVFGSYGELNGGSCSAAFRALTGVREQIMWQRKQSAKEWTEMRLGECEVCSFERPKGGGESMLPDQFFQHLHKCDEKNFLLAASIRREGAHERTDGLMEGHAYSVAQVQDIVLDSKVHLRLLALRNPWGGDKEWRGAWSDRDAAWEDHPEVAAQLRPVVADDGAFWMAWEDFSNIFTTVFISPKAMREGNEAIAHTLATQNWRSVRPQARPRGAKPLQQQPLPHLLRVKWTEAEVAAEASDGGQAKAEERVWQVMLKERVWQDFPEEQQSLFKLAVKRGQEVAAFEYGGQAYEIDFRERVQRSLRTGRSRPVRHVPLRSTTAGEEANFRVGDSVQVWSSSRLCWVEDGLIDEVLLAPIVVDGMTMPPGTLKVCYEGGRATKWIAPQQVTGRLRKAPVKVVAAGPPEPPTTTSFDPPPRPAQPAAEHKTDQPEPATAEAVECGSCIGVKAVLGHGHDGKKKGRRRDKLLKWIRKATEPSTAAS